MLELEGFGVVRLRVVDVLDGASCLMATTCCGVQHATVTRDALVTTRLELSRLSCFLFLLGVLRVTAPIAGLGPSVHHFDLLEPSSHHSIIGILVRAVIYRHDVHKVNEVSQSYIQII